MLPGNIVISMTPEEIMMEDLATSQNVLCKFANSMRKMAELKAEKLKIKHPSGIGLITFDRNIVEGVVTFTENIERAM